MDADCIFCRIVAGEVPATKVYEDTGTLAFLDIAPMASGHVLVIPKQHSTTITETSPSVLHQVIETVRRVAAAQVRGLSATGINVFQANGASAGQVVPHVHFHVIPRSGDEGTPRSWTPGAYDSTDEAAAVAQAIVSGLSGGD